MLKGKLTVKKVERLGAGKHGDGGGLWLEVGDGNARSWVYRWETDGRDHYLGLGPARDISLEEAREAAREARKAVRAGRDPIAEKRQEKAQQKLAAARTRTFGQCADVFWSDRVDGWNPRHALQWSATVRGVFLDGTPSKSDYCKALRNVPVQLIDVPLVLSVIQPIWKTKAETASRVLNRIEGILDWARAAGLRTGDNPASAKLIGKLLPKRERKKESFASVPVRELPAVYAAIAARPGNPARALQFAILTSTRTAEVIDCRWPEISFEDRTWTIPASRMKADVEHRVPLSEAAIELLRALPTDDHDLVFLSSRPGAPMHRNALRKLLQVKLGRKETTHGMRAAFSTWASEVAHAPPPVIEACLAHTISNEVEKAYKRGTLLDRRRDLMTKWATYCTTPPVKSAEESADKVVPLRGAQ
jgi:integrase